MAVIGKREKFGFLKNIGGRMIILALVIFFLAFLIVSRLFYLQVVQHDFYLTLATRAHEAYRDLFPERGAIYVKEKGELYPLVANRDYYLVFAEPAKIKDAGRVIDAITPILGLEKAEWQELLLRLNKKTDPYEPIKHKATKQQVDQIKEKNLEGIGFTAEFFRFYPETGIGGHIFGFVANQGDGQYGLEGFFNKELAGRPGLIKSFKDAWGSLITIGSRSIKKAENGSALVLTIDRQVQFTACLKLKEYVEKFQAEGGTVIIMKPTGAILAMCSLPDFDPEKYNEVTDINYLNNPAIFTAFEPGSVFKAFTMAAGLDTGLVSPETTYNDEGKIKIIGQKSIENSDKKAHGTTTMSQVLEKSLNLGAIFVEQRVGKETFKRYVYNFGFGKRTGLELATEMPGNLSALDKPGEIFGITASYGQGITVTPLQLASAFAAIANQGKLVKPYIVSEIIKPGGEKEIFQSKEVRQVISPKTAAILTGMLISVVENGYGKLARVKGYYLGGKTGTAEVASPGGYGEKTIHTFIGFGPVSRPEFVMLAKLDNPQGPRFAESSSVPLFGQLAQYLLNYYQIAPDY